MESSESYLTQPTEQSLTILMGISPAEQRLIWRIRQLTKEQCLGVLLVFEPMGFGLFKLSKQERIGE